ncbi:MAG: UvrD-helicase domain-containing protein, partial [Alphaproteobacteria bacterium]|nr:UvrD-helicase domain-containing protein [Alphaproteobacteria bacterium]
MIIDQQYPIYNQALNPNSSIWVNASAGTGKTKLLTDRILRLLISDVSPLKILCLTYTKAAAAEMLNRLDEKLAFWASTSEELLKEDIIKLLGYEPDQSIYNFARGLFAKILDIPGGIKIQTIHAFCQSLLRKFPIEANVPSNFELIQEIEDKKIIYDAYSLIMGLQQQNYNSKWMENFAQLSIEFSIEDFDQLILDLIRKKKVFLQSLEKDDEFNRLIDCIYKKLNVEKNISIQSIEDQIMRNTCFSKSNLKVIQEILFEQTKSKKYQKMFNQIKDWMELSFEEKKEQLDFYCGIFLDSYGLLKKTFSSDLIENYPILDETFNQEALR